MNELLQKHGCKNVFSVPEGLKELMSDISREVLRDQPENIFDYITNYLSVLLITREHGVLAVRLLEELCDCRPGLEEHLAAIVPADQVDLLASIITKQIQTHEPYEGIEKVREVQMVKAILAKTSLDESLIGKVCQIARNAFKDYWYRKKLLEEQAKTKSDEPWKIAAYRTLEIYKKTKPSFGELTRAAIKIQAAYKGYYVRKKLLGHLKPKQLGPKVDSLGKPADIGGAREYMLGRTVNVKVKEDNVQVMFMEQVPDHGFPYNPMNTVTHVTEDFDFGGRYPKPRAYRSKTPSRGSKSPRSPISFKGDDSSPSIPSPGSDAPNFKTQYRISFAEAPKIVHSMQMKVSTVTEGGECTEMALVDDIPEEIQDIYVPVKTELIKEITHLHDVPEDIAGDQGDMDSATASVPSGFDTDDQTDIEDLAIMSPSDDDKEIDNENPC